MEKENKKEWEDALLKNPKLLEQLNSKIHELAKHEASLGFNDMNNYSEELLKYLLGVIHELRPRTDILVKTLQYLTVEVIRFDYYKKSPVKLIEQFFESEHTLNKEEVMNYIMRVDEPAKEKISISSK